jgi:hypothetical protein
MRDKFADGYYGDDEVIDDTILNEYLGSGFHVEEPEPVVDFDNIDDLFDHLCKESREEPQ